MDDIFDEDADEEILASKEWSKLRESRLKDGYREGISEGQDSLLQQGFNEGYKDSALKAFHIAELRGKICAVLAFDLSEDGQKSSQNAALLSQDATEKMQELLEEVVELEGELKSNSKEMNKPVSAMRTESDSIHDGKTENSGTSDATKCDSSSVKHSCQAADGDEAGGSCQATEGCCGGTGPGCLATEEVGDAGDGCQATQECCGGDRQSDVKKVSRSADVDRTGIQPGTEMYRKMTSLQERLRSILEECGLASILMEH